MREQVLDSSPSCEKYIEMGRPVDLSPVERALQAWLTNCSPCRARGRVVHEVQLVARADIS